MSETLDLFATLDAPVPCKPPAVETPPDQPERQPAAPIRKPASEKPWRYIHPEGTPAGLIARACLCGGRDERPGPSLENVRCDWCRDPIGMRPRPWRPTEEEAARPHRV